MNIRLPVILCSCALVAGCASDPMGGTSERSTSTQASTTRASLPSEDQRFVMEAAQSGLAEVQIGQLTQQKGQSQEVKSFGQMLITDHQTANQELMAIATRKGLQIPTKISPTERAVISRLSSASGAEFDRLVALENVKAHQKVIQQFQAAQQTVQDPDLKAFIGKTLPVLQNHLKHAEHLQAGAAAHGAGEDLESQSSQTSAAGASNEGQESIADQSAPPAVAPGSPPMNGGPADQQ